MYSKTSTSSSDNNSDNETTWEPYGGLDYDTVWDLTMADKSSEAESSEESITAPTQETTWEPYGGLDYDTVWDLTMADKSSEAESREESNTTPTQETTWEPYGGLDYDTVWDLKMAEQYSQDSAPKQEKPEPSTQTSPAASNNKNYFASLMNFFSSFLEKSQTSADTPAVKVETDKTTVQVPKSEDDKQTAPKDTISPELQWYESPVYNLMFKVPVISAGITSVVQPTNLLMANIINHSNPIKGMPSAPSAIFFALYKGFGNNVVAGQMRGAVSVTAKQSQGVEVAKEAELSTESSSANKGSKMISTVSFAQADTLVAQYGNRGVLTGYYSNEGIFKKMACPLEKIPLTINNVKQIVAMGYPIKTTGGLVTYGAMVIGSDFIENQQFLSNPTTNKVVASMIAGGLASIVTTPISIINDKVVLSTTINNQNQLSRLTFTQSMEVAAHFVKDASFKTKLAYAGPMNAVRSTIIFGTLTFANELLGDQPLKKVKEATVVLLGIFSQKEKDKLTPPVEKAKIEELEEQTGEKENSNKPN
ncbi:hypothetical protein [Legionella waltersii]|uniref:Periplasmic ligand-binding sensor domain protein n=1 Tax=Legionella waltersii TaxID=66969 RepID=A0A0W1AMD2_9GAMM|nr:hypothetical protein [Legionella waltersii]KTD82487.1 periplasmic ligand-binding sensor domain protein [Legionella waltersii]